MGDWDSWGHEHVVYFVERESLRPSLSWPLATRPKAPISQPPEQKRDDLLEDPPSLQPTKPHTRRAGRAPTTKAVHRHCTTRTCPTSPESTRQSTRQPLVTQQPSHRHGIKTEPTCSTTPLALSSGVRGGCLYPMASASPWPSSVCTHLHHRTHISDLDRATCRQQMNTTHPGCKIPTTTFPFRSALSFFAYQFTAALLTNNVSHPFPIDRYAGRESSTVPS